ncbi:GDSL esterase/lipase [Cardamine amara subsp. amara]|uniref:GDSL esterase/lipase n=1 Tax=Cardamine amara subsp. amara TaxID=228776 RepID=A0ABD1A3Y6_CARAN
MSLYLILGAFKENLKMFIMLMNLLVADFYAGAGTGQPLVPALIVMGDSVVDAGNNNRRTTLVKANFPPYGRDFFAHNATGRFSNGKLATDFTAETLGFTSYPVAYLSLEANGTDLLTGANFASGASGYDSGTALLYNAISLNQQLKNYKEYQSKVTSIVGRERANDIISGAIHLLSTGSSDFLQSYYINPILNRILTPDQYSDRLINFYSKFVQNLYDLGARKIGVTTLPPLGCLPTAITIFGGAGRNTCVARLNRDAVSFNTKLNNTSMHLTNKLPGLKLVVFDIYNPLLSMVMNHVKNDGHVVEPEQWKLRSYATQDRSVHVRMLPVMCFGTVFIHLRQPIMLSQTIFLSKESPLFLKSTFIQIYS